MSACTHAQSICGSMCIHGIQERLYETQNYNRLVVVRGNRLRRFGTNTCESSLTMPKPSKSASPSETVFILRTRSSNRTIGGVGSSTLRVVANPMTCSEIKIDGSSFSAKDNTLPDSPNKTLYSSCWDMSHLDLSRRLLNGAHGAEATRISVSPGFGNGHELASGWFKHGIPSSASREINKQHRTDAGARRLPPSVHDVTACCLRALLHDVQT